MRPSLQAYRGSKGGLAGSQTPHCQVAAHRAGQKIHIYSSRGASSIIKGASSSPLQQQPSSSTIFVSIMTHLWRGTTAWRGRRRWCHNTSSVRTILVYILTLDYPALLAYPTILDYPAMLDYPASLTFSFVSRLFSKLKLLDLMSFSRTFTSRSRTPSFFASDRSYMCPHFSLSTYTS